MYASTRAEELAVVPWDDAQKDAFLRAQFDAQDAWYREAYAQALAASLVTSTRPAGTPPARERVPVAAAA